MPHFIHSTSKANLILLSGKFLGSNKQMSKTGMTRAEVMAHNAANANNQIELTTLFARPEHTLHSVARIGERSGRNIRGVLIFSNENNQINDVGQYPSVAGAEVLLNTLNLRLVLLEFEDCEATASSCCGLRTNTSDSQDYIQLTNHVLQLPQVLIERVRNLRGITVQAMNAYIATIPPVGPALGQQLAPAPVQEAMV